MANRRNIILSDDEDRILQALEDDYDSDLDPLYVPDDSDDDDSSTFSGFDQENAMLSQALHTMALDEVDHEDGEEGATQAIWSEYSGRMQNFPFTGRSGVLKNLNETSTPYEVYSHLFNDRVLDLIVDETNKYARQIHETTTPSPRGKERRSLWIPTNREEIKTFLALIIWMGLFRAGSIEDYWKKSILYRTSMVEKMSRNRFQLLLARLHFADNMESQQGNRLSKIETLLDILNENFQALYRPEEDVVIDETLIPWRGRLVFRQYIPNKAHKYGIKLFKVCSTKGYTYKLSIYTGQARDGTRQQGLAQSVCTDLMSNLLNEGRTLYVDNFYTSYELAVDFLKKKTHVVGTLRSRKKNIPKEILNAKLQKGQMIARQDQNGIVVLKWLDARDVRLLSYTLKKNSRTTVVHTVKRNQKM